MATNGESARKWLEENREQISEERILQIRSNLVKKINQMADADNLNESDETSRVVRRALDVMDAWLQERSAPPGNSNRSINAGLQPAYSGAIRTRPLN